MTPELIEGAKQAQDFLKPITTAPMHELGQLFADQVKIWRFKNQVNNLKKAQKIAKEAKIDIKKINNKVLFEYLDGVALEDDETLQDMWANLFVNYIDCEKNLTLIVYPQILRQLSTNEVKLLNLMYNDIPYDNMKTFEDPNDFNLIEVNNMVRLGILTDEDLQRAHKHSNCLLLRNKNNAGYMANLRFYLTLFGVDFLNACRR